MLELSVDFFDGCDRSDSTVESCYSNAGKRIVTTGRGMKSEYELISLQLLRCCDFEYL
jgi:hypothetical protein